MEQWSVLFCCTGLETEPSRLEENGASLLFGCVQLLAGVVQHFKGLIKHMPGSTTKNDGRFVQNQLGH